MQQLNVKAGKESWRRIEASLNVQIKYQHHEGKALTHTIECLDTLKLRCAILS